MPGLAPVTQLGDLIAHDRDQAEKIIRKALVMNAGHVSKTARALHVSRTFLFYCLNKLGLNKLPTELREKFKTRYRLPPLEADAP